MAKKRRTRSQKIIASLRRQVGKKQLKIKTPVSYNEPIKSKTAQKAAKKKVEKQASLYNYDPSLIKKDLLKTVYLAVLFFVIIGIFWWYFEGISSPL